MHIGIDTRLTYYRTGGISTYMRRLVEALETLDTDHHYTVFRSRKSNEDLTKHMGSAALWTPCHHRLERYALSAELLRFKLDVFHSPDFIPPLRGAKRHIITVHDLTFLHYPQFLTPDARRFYNGQIAWAVQHADHILVDSQSTKNDLVDMLRVTYEKITVHMLGVDERFRPLPASDPRELNLPSEFILFVGTFEPRKNVLGLLEAYRHLTVKLTDAPPLVLVGRRGWLFEDTLKKINEMHLDQRVIWREDISDEALPIVYNLASVLVMPSFYEGFGLTALEAMACGTVPIVSNRSSLPEVVGDVGLQINPENPLELAAALEHSLTDTGWREGMQQRALERAAQFTWEKTASLALAAYRLIGETS